MSSGRLHRAWESVVVCNTHTCPVHSIAHLSSEMELNNS
jgi:hypothetical protein